MVVTVEILAFRLLPAKAASHHLAGFAFRDNKLLFAGLLEIVVIAFAALAHSCIAHIAFFHSIFRLEAVRAASIGFKRIIASCFSSQHTMPL